MNTIVLVVDRLHAGFLGAYGNSWIETPAFDRLASRATVFDQYLVNSPRLEGLYRAFWEGRHPLAPALADPRAALPSLLARQGVATTLLTDEPAVANHPLAGQFASQTWLDVPETTRLAYEIDQTHLGQCFARMVATIESAREPFFLWCHLQGFGGPWDAPWEYRARFAEDDDPDPPNSAGVPREKLDDDHDPDHLLGITHAYAGQVLLFDNCLGALVDLIDDRATGPTFLALASARGFPLGEHGTVGPFENGLYSELVHVPLVCRFPNGLGEAARSQSLVEPADLFATLVELSNADHKLALPAASSLAPLAADASTTLRNRICIAGATPDRAIRTPAWFLRNTTRPELFAKPDDRWDVNNVADRCRDVVDLLLAAVAEQEQSIRSDTLEPLSPLPELLLSGLE